MPGAAVTGRPGRRPIPATPAQLALLREMAAAGMSDSRLERVMDEAGIARRRHQADRNATATAVRKAPAAPQAAGTPVPPQWAQAAQLRIEHQDESPGELAARAGVSKHALAGRLRRLIRAGGQP
jgi:hypothetical protein